MIMKKNVSSTNQQGGITAGEIGEINIHQDSTNGPKESKISKIAAIVTVLGFLGFGVNQMNEKYNIFNVSSTGQQGGITAGKINQLNVYNKPAPRELVQGYKDELNRIISKHSGLPLVIEVNSNDREAVNFGNQIYQYLVSAGYNVSEPDKIMMSSDPMPAFGYRVNVGKLFIVIGSQN